MRSLTSFLGAGGLRQALDEALAAPVPFTGIPRSRRKRPHGPQYTKLGHRMGEWRKLRTARGHEKVAARVFMIEKIAAERRDGIDPKYMHSVARGFYFLKKAMAA